MFFIPQTSQLTERFQNLQYGDLLELRLGNHRDHFFNGVVPSFANCSKSIYWPGPAVTLEGSSHRTPLVAEAR